MKTIISYLGVILAALILFASCDVGVAYTVGTLGYQAGNGSIPGLGKSLVTVPKNDQYRITQDMFFPEEDLIVVLIEEDGTAKYIGVDQTEIFVYENYIARSSESDSERVSLDEGYAFKTLGQKRVKVEYQGIEQVYVVTVYDPNAQTGNPSDPGGGGSDGGGMGWIWSHKP
jgi:hypothetical protein